MIKSWRVLKARIFLFIFLLFLLSGKAVIGLAVAQDFTQSIMIPIPLGLELIETLSNSEKNINTTSQRREQKAVIPDQEWESILSVLKHGNPTLGVPPVEFQLRDAVNKQGMLNGTFTFYGRAATFRNKGELTTKVRLRARLYINASPDFQFVERTKKTKDTVFLELKIKNPTFAERNGSHKYRVRISDRDLLNLFRADPDLPEFQEVVEGIKRSAVQLGNDPKKVVLLFDAVKRLAQLKDPSNPTEGIGKEFIRPQYITAYTRVSYSFIEKGYPITKLDSDKNKKCRPGVVQFKRCRKEKLKIELCNVEYQLTVDDHVTAFIPKIEESDETIDIQRYFGAEYKGLSAHYPEHSKTVEFKEPANVALLRTSFRSQNHRFLQAELLDRMKRNVLDGFTFNKGKSGHLAKLLNEKLENDEPKLKQK